jgi:hypothetical protein
MRAELIGPGDARWGAFLADVPHDFYHLPEYVALSARQEGGEPAAFWAEDRDTGLLVPLVLRPVPAGLAPEPGWRDAATPYGYPCPLWRNPGAEADLDRLLAAFRATGAGAGIVCAFLRLHPLLPLPDGPLMAHGQLVDQGRTVYLDLARPKADLDRDTRANHLADVRRLAREGYRAQVDAWDQLEAFVGVYRETMALRAADPYYFFGLDYFRDLRRCLGARLHLCSVLAPGGELAAAGLFTEVGDLMQFHLSGTAEAHRRTGAAKLMLVHMRDWARERGLRHLHLGGGVGCREDSLAFFKQGFSKSRGRYLTLRMVLDPAAYAALAGRRRGPAEDPGDGFFPAYRRPGAAPPDPTPALSHHGSAPEARP